MGVFTEYSRESNWRDKDYYNNNNPFEGIGFGPFGVYLTNNTELSIKSIDFSLGKTDIPYGVEINLVTPEGAPIVKNNLEEKDNQLKEDYSVIPEWKELEIVLEDMKKPEEKEEILKIPVSTSVQNNTKENYNYLGRTIYSSNSILDMGNIPSKSSNKAGSLMNMYKNIELPGTNTSVPAHIAAGILGNLYVESSFNTTAYNGNDLGLVSRGIMLWDPNRMNKLKQYAKSRNKKWYAVETLLEFILYELKNYYPTEYNNLLKSKTPLEASEALAPYIGYAGWNGSTNTAKKAGWSQSRVNQEHKKRQAYAQEIYRNWKY